jgi:hypothetical protein
LKRGAAVEWILKKYNTKKWCFILQSTVKLADAVFISTALRIVHAYVASSLSSTLNICRYWFVIKCFELTPIGVSF